SGTSPNIVGTCAANAAACPTGSAPQGCGQATDCPGQTCCVMTPTGGGPSTITCQATCTGGAPACGGMSADNVDCPGDGTGTGWACVPIPGTPQAVAGKCVAVDAGTTPVDSGVTPPDTGTPDTGVDAGATPDTGAPHDAAADGG
ncbi:MAG: hypothetical protein M3O46_18415, partial [Myxococcota bacterium]|nr:hypothetical protein [Myxococcota bacterium]